MPQTDEQLPNVLLLTAPACVHCAALKIIFQKLLVSGLINKLEIVDVAQHPELASRYGVRSVPWFMLDTLQFQGSYTESEIREWIKQLGTREGLARYFKQALSAGKLDSVMAMVRGDPTGMYALLSLLMDDDNDIKVRLGISAVFEEYEGTPLLRDVTRELIQLANHSDAKIRADAAHFLSLTHDKAALPFLQKLCSDPDREVKEIAIDALSESDRFQ